jgi:hypothetical protein
MKGDGFAIRIFSCFRNSYKKALSTAWWILRIMLPISLAVMVLQYFGILQYISDFLSPVFKHIGLHGESALVYITCVLLNIYAAIAVIGTLALNMREITILAVMCLIAHNMIVETTIQKRTGSNVIRIILLRIICSFIAAAALNWLLPKTLHASSFSSHNVNYGSITEVFRSWFSISFWLSLKLILIVTGLMFLQKILDEFGVMDILSRIFRPLMAPLGLSSKISFHWIIAITIGLTYGSAIMFEQVETGKLSIFNANILNQHIAVCHSLLEDTLLFFSIGVAISWLLFPRIIIAIAVVWLYRLEKYIFKKTNL